MDFSAQQIAAFLNGDIEGNAEVSVNNFSKIEEGKPGTLTFLANMKYEHYIYDTKADIVIVNRDFKPTSKISATLIKVDDAYTALSKLMQLAENEMVKTNAPKLGIDPLAFVDPSAKIAEGVFIGPFAYVGAESEIGANSYIAPHCYIGKKVKCGENCKIEPQAAILDDTIIGNRCIIHSGAVIGADGFGFAPDETGYHKIPQLGNVLLEDDVEIGSNTCIDRAVMGSTTIHKGVKLDNLIQIAHNVEVGSHTVMAAQAGISGSTKVGEWCMFGGQTGLVGHITIGDKTNIGAQSGILGNVKPKSKIMGTPAINVRDFLRSASISAKLPELDRTVRELKKEVEKLKKELNK